MARAAAASQPEPPPTATRTAAGVQQVTTPEEAAALALHLMSAPLPGPVAVLSVASEHTVPFIDAHALKAEIGNLGEVHVLPPGKLSWVFSDAMPPGTAVYGGAGRVYGTDGAWRTNPFRSRLHFAFSPADSPGAVAELSADILTSAMASGLTSVPQTREDPTATGVVKQLIGARALVALDGGHVATIWAELTAPGVHLPQLLTVEQRVEGTLDADQGRLDVRLSLRAPATALAGYAAGDVILAHVCAVTDDTATLTPYPGVDVHIPRECITDNPHDRLTDLLTPGEVVLAGIESLTWDAGAASFELRLDTIDNDEHTGAPSLLPGGPPWLTLPSQEALTALPTPAPPAGSSLPPAARPVPAPATTPAEPESLPSRIRELERDNDGLHGTVEELRQVAQELRAAAFELRQAVDERRLDALGSDERPRTHAPALADDRQLPRPGPAHIPAPQPAPAVSAPIPVPALQGPVPTEASSAFAELDALQSRLRELEQDNGGLRRTAEELRTKLRESGGQRRRAERQAKAVAAGAGTPAFLDPTDQFRHEVYLEWAQRIAPADKAQWPLRPYTLSEGFLPSLDAVQGIDRTKVVAVVVEVLVGLDKELDSRDRHVLRVSAGGGAAATTRPDGATCWRVALQRGSASARRLHYWLGDGTVELARVVTHDDMAP